MPRDTLKPDRSSLVEAVIGRMIYELGLAEDYNDPLAGSVIYEPQYVDPEGYPSAYPTSGEAGSTLDIMDLTPAGDAIAAAEAIQDQSPLALALAALSLGIPGTIKPVGEALDMSHAARMERAAKAWPEVGYHGTGAGDISSIDWNKLSDESLFGRGFYVTSSPDVAGGRIANEFVAKKYPSRAEAEAVTLPVDRWRMVDLDPEWYSAERQLKIEAPGYAHKGMWEKMPPEERGIVGKEFENLIASDGRTAAFEKEYASKHLADWIETGNEGALETLRRQPFGYKLEQPVLDMGRLPGAVYPLRFNPGKTFDVSAVPTPESINEIISSVPDDLKKDVLREMALSAKDAGRGVINKDVYDALMIVAPSKHGEAANWANGVLQSVGYQSLKHQGARTIGARLGYEPHTVHVLFEPHQGQVRSQFAKFDLDKKDLPDLSAGILPLTAGLMGLGAAGDYSSE